MSVNLDIFRDVRDVHINLERIRELGSYYVDLYLHRDKYEKHKDKKLLNKVVIITGASSGIGRACALEYAKQGAKVVLAARNLELLLKLEDEIKNNKNEAFTIRTDITKETECKNLINRTLVKYGKIDILVSNAGISMRALFAELNLVVLKKLMDVNFWGLVYCTKYALPHILKSNGSLIAVSSVAAFTALPGRTGYCASKSAVNGFINSLRVENLKNNINIMLVSPGFTESNIRRSALNKLGYPQKETPLKEEKLMSSREVALAIVKATIKRKRSLILTFNAKLAYLVSKFNPALVDKVMFNKMAKEENSPL